MELLNAPAPGLKAAAGKPSAEHYVRRLRSHARDLRRHGQTRRHRPDLHAEHRAEFCLRPVYEEYDVAEMSFSWYIMARGTAESRCAHCRFSTLRRYRRSRHIYVPHRFSLSRTERASGVPGSESEAYRLTVNPCGCAEFAATFMGSKPRMPVVLSLEEERRFGAVAPDGASA